ncbi:serine/threonine-protein phosphatase [Streptomyces scopuliridis]|uniref:PP2C family protein-serine/threonine phosphatase n=1 Tax=Streptomyces scopuliridis TaxID=452529 RepID=UPI002DDAC977|nr:PP2C family protein-serine/threonine phosphatase [Streptomyces scopuliridis]WSB34868.1 serine/threonine-protein phosphatase [Streptomyces scopuliridis]
MSAPHMPKVAGIDSTVPAPTQTASPLDALPAAPGALIQDRLAGWVSDLTTLHELTERLARTRSLDGALHELLRAGAALVGARRGLVLFEPADGLGPVSTLGLGLSHADLGHLETVPRRATSYGRLLDGPDGPVEAVAVPDLLADTDAGTETGTGTATGTGTGTGTGTATGRCTETDPRQREVAARLGLGASYAVPLLAGGAGSDPRTAPPGEPPQPAKLGAAVWLYDKPGEPTERQRHLIGLYVRYAGEHLARLLELERARAHVTALTHELLPGRLPRMPGVQLAARHRTAAGGGGDWYDALPLPEGALSLAVGSVSGSGPSAMAAMGRLRAALRAYAVMEGEDPIAVLSDLELLLRLTEPARTATALFAYAEPARRTLVLAGAGHAPPLVVGDRRTEFVETSLSAPLGMLSCWQAPSVELVAAPGETVLLYTDGLLRRTGEPMDRAFARLHTAAASVPATARDDPGAVADHVLRALLPPGPGPAGSGTAGPRTAGFAEPAEDFVLLAARFE